MTRIPLQAPASRFRPLSPSALVAFTACVHRTELERARDARLVERPYFADSALAALIARGQKHERAFLEELRAGARDVVEIPTANLNTREALEEAARQTGEAMRRGTDVIYQATFFDGTWRGHADFLIRTKAPSTLGAFSYEPWDTKLAREPRATALVQLCAYAGLIEQIQGTAPEKVYLVLGGPERRVEPFRLASIAPYHRRVRKLFLDHLARAGPAVFPVKDPYPDPVEHCEICDWQSICEERWRDDDYLALVAGITRKQRRALRERGVSTLASLSKLDLPITPPLARTSLASVVRIREQARVQREGRERGSPVYELIPKVEPGMGLEALPAPSRGDLFFDIEGDPFVDPHGREYLFGYVETEASKYEALWSFDAATERTSFEAIVDLMHSRHKADPGMHVYHFAPYEPSTLKRLAARLATRVEEVDELLRAGVFVDLFRIVRQGVRASVESYSIKKLEPFFGFRREIDLQKAGDARAALELWMESGLAERLPGHEEICEKVRLYNRDDCLAAWKLRDWLEERREELGRVRGGEVPRPPAQVVEEDPERSAERIALDELQKRILAKVPAEGRTPEQQAEWLVAHLLQWHWREDKSTWWDYFRMCELTDQELIEDRTPIGGIRYLGPAGTVKKSTIHRYEFPEQEYDVEPGDRCREPRQDIAVVVRSLDDAAGTFDLTRKSSDPPPEVRALVPLQVLATAAQRARLQELAEWVAGHGIVEGKRHRLARDLLLRVPPAAGSLLRPGESASKAAVRLVLDLAKSPRGGVLPIQGPPGTGKTHTGAEMILDLVAKGFRVGVTANSHKVIGNLLAKTCELARNAGSTLAIAQRAGEEDGHSDSFVTLHDDNAGVQATLAEGTQIAAGTAWLWADLDPGSVDVLFVDEAGQMSLANVVSMAHAARVLVLLGDPMQLDQPRKGVHPPGAEVSALEHVLGPLATMPADRGLFLDRTWRLNPALCRFTSETFYEGRLQPRPGNENQKLLCEGPLGGAGLRWWPVEHEGNQSESPEEVAAVQDLVSRLLNRHARWVDAKGSERALTLRDILVVAPYNAHVRELTAALPSGARVGTVDKFQGQEAPVVIYSMATSTPEDAPRGMEFLYSLNRLNVATSRAQCVAILVASPALLPPSCKTPRQVMQASALCAAVESAESHPDLARP